MRPATFGLFLLACGLFAQDRHVSWKLSVDPPAAPPGGKVLVRMAGHIDDGWHLYSMSTPAASPTKIQLAASPAIEKFRALEQPAETEIPLSQRKTDQPHNSTPRNYLVAPTSTNFIPLLPSCEKWRLGLLLWRIALWSIFAL